MKPQIKEIQKQCLKGRLPVVDAVSQIDQAIGGITRVDYKPGLKFTITNHNAAFSLNMPGLSKKELSNLEGLAVVAYFKAKENGSLFPGELHISKQASTKHHMEGIYEILSRYAA